MEDIIVTIITALGGVLIGFGAALIAKGRKSIEESSNKWDDKILELLDAAIEDSKKK